MADRLTNGDSTTQSMTVAAALLRHYSFDMAGQSIGEMIATWAQVYPSAWLRAAVIEALYQGRYKAVSVQQILTIWQRRSRTLCHFNGEFERIVCSPVLEDNSLDSVAEELAMIVKSESLASGVQNSTSSESNHLSHEQEQLNGFASVSSESPSDHGSIPPLRPFAHTPQSELSGDRTTINSPNPAINPFIPESDSAFCQRLQAISNADSAESEDLMSDQEAASTSDAVNSSTSVDSSGSETSRLDEWAEGEEDTSNPSSLEADLRSLTNAGTEAWD